MGVRLLALLEVNYIIQQEKRGKIHFSNQK